tara:strand:+ start:519 stop:863 length:345 start_codon:yes stop_codon:yes gene_type:complete
MRITNPKKRKLFCLDSGLIVLFVRSQNRALCIKLCVKKVSPKVFFFDFVGRTLAWQARKQFREEAIFDKRKRMDAFSLFDWAMDASLFCVVMERKDIVLYEYSFFFHKILQQPP